MGESPPASLFEFWELSSHSIEEQLLMYDIPFTENHVVESGSEKENFYSVSSSSLHRETQGPKQTPDDEEALYLPASRVKEQKGVDVDAILKSLLVMPTRVIPVVPDIEPESIIEEPTSPRSEVKVDKYGFVVEEEEEEEKKEIVSRKRSGTGRDRSVTLSRKKTHKTEEKWRNISKNLEVFLGEKRKKLKKLLRRGVPDSLRAEIWKGLMDVNDLKKTSGDIFQTLQQQECSEDFERVILKDLSRTLPHHIMFQEGGQGRESLHKILKAYSLYNPSVGYCQGMGFLAAMFLIYMQEEDAFFMLIQVIDKLGLSGIFAEGLVAVKEHLFIHSQLCKTVFPKLNAHLEETVVVHGCMPVENPWDVAKLYATQWFFNIFIHVLPFEFILRIWDVLLYDGFMVAHQVALAILKLSQKDLMKLRFDGLLMFLKDIDTYLSKNVTVDQFINACVEYKIGSRITKLSKTYQEQFAHLPM